MTAYRYVLLSMLLTALPFFGSSARAAQQLAAEPASSSAPVAAAVTPAAFQGRWQPVSRALEGPGDLTLTARSVRWSVCGGSERAVHLPAGHATPAAEGQTLVALFDPAVGAPSSNTPICRLDGQPVAYLRLGAVEGQACQMQASLYASSAHLARNERMAWGVYSRAGCTQQPAPR